MNRKPAEAARRTDTSRESRCQLSTTARRSRRRSVIVSATVENLFPSERTFQVAIERCLHFDGGGASFETGSVRTGGASAGVEVNTLESNVSNSRFSRSRNSISMIV